MTTDGANNLIPLVGAAAPSVETKPKRGYEEDRDPRRRPDTDWQLYQDLVNDSPLEPLAARELYARVAIVSNAQIMQLQRKLQQEHKLTGDEHRSLTGAMNQLKHALRALGARKPTANVHSFGDDE